eukprot:1178895-Prorocentrum_minimum.AAC.1
MSPPPHLSGPAPCQEPVEHVQQQVHPPLVDDLELVRPRVAGRVEQRHHRATDQHAVRARHRLLQ